MDNEEIIKNSLDELCAIFASINDEKLMREFFTCMFTPAELKDFSKRWCLVKELDAGTTQREIAKKYNLSLCNITRGSRELKKEDSAFRKILELYKNLKPENNQ